MRFGLECLNTGRFDTDVPMFFREALEKIGTEYDDWRDALKFPGVYEPLQKYFLGMIGEPTREKDRDCWKTNYGMTAWMTGHYKDAKTCFDELGTNIHAHVFKYYDIAQEDALAETRVACGPHKAAFCEAEALYQGGQSVGALPLFEALREKMRGDPDLPVIEARVAVLQLKAKMMGGEWADLFPGKSLAGWRALSGEWSMQDGGSVLQGVSTDKASDARIVGKLRFPPDYEIRGECDAQYKYGVLLGYKPRTHATVRVDRYQKVVRYGFDSYRAENSVKAEGLPRKTRFLIRVKDSCISVFVDDKPCFESELLDSMYWNPHSGQVGFGEYFGKHNGYTMKYSKLQVRQLIKEP